MLGAGIGLGIASYQLALQQQAAFNQLNMQSIGQAMLTGRGQRGYKSDFDVSLDEMKRDFDNHLKDWDKPVDNAI